VSRPMAGDKKIAWVDCSSGVAGNMLLAALIDLGFSGRRLKELAQSLKFGKVQLNITRAKRNGVSGTLVRIAPEGRQPERNFSAIKRIIARGRMPDIVKKKSIDCFLRLAKAEAKIHGVKVEQIHFHELGAIDTIIDIAGAFLGFYELELEQVFAGRIRLGEGQVRCGHGLLPLPAPATLELLAGVPVIGGSETEGELTTPTGAALITSLARAFGPMPEMKLEKTGYGLGEREIESRPNVLRIALGQGAPKTEQLIQLETTIDDMNPEFFEPLRKAALQAGALETALFPAQLKKGRPGVILQLLCQRSKLEDIINVVFMHSTTTGVRFFEVDRVALARKSVSFKSSFGTVRLKIISLPNGEKRIHPEYDSLARIAGDHKISLLELEQKVKKEWLEKQREAKS